MIQVNDISKVYNKGRHSENAVLSHASLTLPDTGLIFLVGQSGIGKSTILNAIGGLISYEGEILYDGNKVDIETYRRRNIGYVFQDFLLLPNESIRDNIALAFHIAGVYDESLISRRVNELLKAVGLNVNPSRNANALSLGQRQRVAIARALATEPKVILADEPTGNLDSRNSLRVMDILKALSRDHLVLVVTHNTNLVHLYADRAFAIENKAFVEIDPKGENLDSEYASSPIRLAPFHKEELKQDHVLLRLYTQENAPEVNLTLVQEGGRILIVGENVSIVSREEIRFLEENQKTPKTEPEEEKKAVDTAKPSLPPSVPSPAGADGEVALSTLPPIGQLPEGKRPFRDTGLVQTFKEIITGNYHPIQGKNRFGKRLGFFLEILLPMLMFGLLNFGRMTLNSIEASFLTPYHLSDTFTLKTKPGAPKNTLVEVTPEMMESWVNDPASGILDLPAYNVDESKNKPEDSFFGQSVTTDYPMAIDFPLSSFSVLAGRTDLDDSYRSNQRITFLSAESYAPIVPGLKTDLEENHIVLDVSYEENLKAYSDDGKRLPLTGAKLTLPIPGLGNAQKYLTLTVDEVIDSHFHGAFASQETTRRLRMLQFHYFRSQKGYYGSDSDSGIMRYPQSDWFWLPDLKDYTILRQSDLTLDEYKDRFAIADTSISYGSVKNASLGWVSKGVLQDLAFSRDRDNTSGKELLYSPLLQTDPDDLVQVKNQEKVIVLQEKSAGTGYDSYDLFRYRVFLNRLLNRAKPDITLDGKGLLARIPMGLYKLSHGEDWATLPDPLVNSFPFSEMVTVEGPYEGTIDDPILVNPSLYREITSVDLLLGQRFAQNEKYYATYSPGFDADSESYGKSPRFLTRDLKKSVQYFQDHPEIGLTVVTGNSGNAAFLKVSLTDSLRPFLIAVLITLGIALLLFLVNGISKVNSNLYVYGVLRSLGMPKGQIVLDEAGSSLSFLFFTLFLPTFLVALLMMVFRIYYLGFYYLLFLLVVTLAYLLMTLIPLLLVLAKKPNSILRSLN